ncbi:MAG: ethanolamine utilization protein EutA [Alphaproteobacteria bacterium]|nr:MAG: ethanolamine utilization protein EutA [Alphaproteobacteria bacterium]
MQQELYTIPESCKILSLGATSLYQHINEGRIRAVKLGKKTLLPREAINDFIASLPAYNSENAEV